MTTELFLKALVTQDQNYMKQDKLEKRRLLEVKMYPIVVFLKKCNVYISICLMGSLINE